MTPYRSGPALSPSSQQVQESGLATPRGSHDANHLAGVEVDGDVFENVFGGALLTATRVVHRLVWGGTDVRLTEGEEE